MNKKRILELTEEKNKIDNKISNIRPMFWRGVAISFLLGIASGLLINSFTNASLLLSIAGGFVVYGAFNILEFVFLYYYDKNLTKQDIVIEEQLRECQKETKEKELATILTKDRAYEINREYNQHYTQSNPKILSLNNTKKH